MLLASRDPLQAKRASRRLQVQLSASPSPSPDGPQDVDSARIEVVVNGNRRSLEALYLEVCELAKRNGLKVEYRLTKGKPADQPET